MQAHASTNVVNYLDSHGQPVPVTLGCHVCENRGGCLSSDLLHNEDVMHQGVRIYRKGEHVYREAEVADAFYLVRSGSVKTYFISEDGEEQVLGFYLPGDVFGLDSCDDQTRCSSANILETTSLCRFSMDCLGEPGNGAKVLKLASDQLVRDHNIILMLSRKDADGRMASLLSDLSRRHELRGYSGKKFNLSMSRQDIGCYLGLAVETVSRTLTRFQECGVLRVNRREVEIMDDEALHRLSGPQVSRIRVC